MRSPRLQATPRHYDGRQRWMRDESEACLTHQLFHNRSLERGTEIGELSLDCGDLRPDKPPLRSSVH